MRLIAFITEGGERLGNLREVNLFGCSWSGLGLVRMGNNLPVDTLE